MIDYNKDINVYVNIFDFFYEHTLFFAKIMELISNRMLRRFLINKLQPIIDFKGNMLILHMYHSN